MDGDENKRNQPIQTDQFGYPIADSMNEDECNASQLITTDQFMYPVSDTTSEDESNCSQPVPTPQFMYPGSVAIAETPEQLFTTEQSPSNTLITTSVPLDAQIPYSYPILDNRPPHLDPSLPPVPLVDPGFVLVTPVPRSNGAKRLTREQADCLEAEFGKCTKPTTERKKSLAAFLGVDHPKVINWFQNRRAKKKQMDKQLATKLSPLGVLNYARPSTDDIALPITEDIVQPITDDITLSILDDITTPNTDDNRIVEHFNRTMRPPTIAERRLRSGPTTISTSNLDTEPHVSKTAHPLGRLHSTSPGVPGTRSPRYQNLRTAPPRETIHRINGSRVTKRQGSSTQPSPSARSFSMTLGPYPAHAMTDQMPMTADPTLSFRHNALPTSPSTADAAVLYLPSTLPPTPVTPAGLFMPTPLAAIPATGSFTPCTTNGDFSHPHLYPVTVTPPGDNVTNEYSNAWAEMPLTAGAVPPSYSFPSFHYGNPPNAGPQPQQDFSLDYLSVEQQQFANEQTFSRMQVAPCPYQQQPQGMVHMGLTPPQSAPPCKTSFGLDPFSPPESQHMAELRSNEDL